MCSKCLCKNCSFFEDNNNNCVWFGETKETETCSHIFMKNHPSGIKKARKDFELAVDELIKNKS